MLKKLISKFQGGDLRSIGKSNEIAKEAKDSPEIIYDLIELLSHSDPLIKLRAADSLEKATVTSNWKLLTSKKATILKNFETTQQEVKWHLAQIIPRIELNSSETDYVVRILKSWFENDESKIVRVFSMQAIFDLSVVNPELKQTAVDVIYIGMQSNISSIRSRAKILSEKVHKL